MRKKLTRKRHYFSMESAMTAILQDASGKMHHGILFDRPVWVFRAEKRSAQASAHPLSQAQGGLFCVFTMFVCLLLEF